MFAIKISYFYIFLGDLTIAMETPLLGEKPLLADLDLAYVGLDAGPKAPLLIGGAGPSASVCSGGEGLVISFSLFYLLLYFGVSDIS
jgi:hypothetical protein